MTGGIDRTGTSSGSLDSPVVRLSAVPPSPLAPSPPTPAHPWVSGAPWTTGAPSTAGHSLHLETHVRAARPAGPQPDPGTSVGAPPRRTAVVVLPVAALAGLAACALAVFLPWAPDGSALIRRGLGIAVLAVVVALALAACSDLVTGRLRATGLAALPALAAAAVVSAGAVAALAGAGGATTALATVPRAGTGPLVLLVGLVVATLAGDTAAVGFARSWDGDPEGVPARSPRRAVSVGGAVAAALVLIGATGGVLAVPAAGAGTGGDPATFRGGTGVLTAALPPIPAVVPIYGGPMPATPCPALAATAMPEAVGAVLVARSPSVHLALCQGRSGRLYWFAANPTTRMTVTLPAVRGPAAWSATDSGVTYVVTETRVRVERTGSPVADEPLSGGW